MPFGSRRKADRSAPGPSPAFAATRGSIQRSRRVMLRPVSSVDVAVEASGGRETAGIIARRINPSHRRRLMKSLALVTAIACLVAAPLAAQQDTSHARHPGARAGMRRPAMPGGGGDEMMAMMREMMAPMMRVMAYTPGS